MSSIYIHIPFCKQRCSYCDFYSTTGDRKKQAYIDMLCKEIIDRKDYLKEPVGTVYFGGGTPSLLSAADFEQIFHTLQSVYGEGNSREITLEANPDDITSTFVEHLLHLPFNRISLGVQSFNNNELRYLSRRHDADSAIRAVKLLQQSGYANINIDLIYGLPCQRLDIWADTLRQALDLQVQHISAYHLIFEEGTRLYRQLKKGRILPVDEETSNRMYEILIDTLQTAGYEHYEISNFARPGFLSRHNSAYWNGTHYLGIGASAHSYNGISRQWNAKSLGYLKKDCGVELPNDKSKYNEYIITRLRTMKGIDTDELTSLFGDNRKSYCLQQAGKYIANGLLSSEENLLKLTRKGIFLSNGITLDLMM